MVDDRNFLNFRMVLRSGMVEIFDQQVLRLVISKLHYSFMCIVSRDSVSLVFPITVRMNTEDDLKVM